MEIPHPGKKSLPRRSSKSFPLPSLMTQTLSKPLTPPMPIGMVYICLDTRRSPPPNLKNSLVGSTWYTYDSLSSSARKWSIHRPPLHVRLHALSAAPQPNEELSTTKVCEVVPEHTRLVITATLLWFSRGPW